MGRRLYLQDFSFYTKNIKSTKEIFARIFARITTFKTFHLLLVIIIIPKMLKVSSITFDWKLPQNEHITYCATLELLNSDSLISLAVKRVGLVGPCAGTMGWVGSVL